MYLCGVFENPLRNSFMMYSLLKLNFSAISRSENELSRKRASIKALNFADNICAALKNAALGGKAAEDTVKQAVYGK